MRQVVIQKGHCFRKRGSTGTAGHRGTEQQFVDKLGTAMVNILRFHGVSAVSILADEHVPASEVFVALHQDGSSNSSARGASIGYPSYSNDGRELGQLWKAMYQRSGWPSGFRPDNYTAGLRRYYAYKYSTARAKLLIEHGFATNRYDEDWMWNHLLGIAETNALAIMRFLNIDRKDGDMAGIITTYHDTANDSCWVIRDDTGASRSISDPAQWLSTWDGPTVSANNLRFVLKSLDFDVTF